MKLIKPNILIREAEDSDLPVLANIEEQADQLSKDRFPAEMSVCSIEELTDAKNSGLLFVAEYEIDVVGFALTRRHEGYLHLQQLSVLPEYGQRGIGSQLLQIVLDLVEMESVKGITLTTFSDIRWNAPFYRKHGFTVADKSIIPGYITKILEKEKSYGLTNRVAMISSVQDILE